MIVGITPSRFASPEKKKDASELFMFVSIKNYSYTFNLLIDNSCYFLFIDAWWCKDKMQYTFFVQIYKLVFAGEESNSH